MTGNDPRRISEQDLQDESYRRYQLDWMASHNRSPRELVLSVLGYHIDTMDPEDTEDAVIDSRDKACGLFDGWEGENGFSGSLWVCKDEFLGAEYQDPDYIRHLLPDGLFATWSDYQSRPD